MRVGKRAATNVNVMVLRLLAAYAQDCGNIKHGWLSPTGTFHAVQRGGHLAFATERSSAIHPDDHLLSVRWLKLAGAPSRWFGTGAPTARQVDFIHDWCRSEGRDFGRVTRLLRSSVLRERLHPQT